MSYPKDPWKVPYKRSAKYLEGERKGEIESRFQSKFIAAHTVLGRFGILVPTEGGSPIFELYLCDTLLETWDYSA